MNSLPAQNSTSISQQIPPADRKLADAVASILTTVERVGAGFVAKRLPAPELRNEIKLRLADVRRALMPLERSLAEKERAARAVAAMLSGWVNARVADPGAKVSAYIATLGDLPCWAVEQVCADVARGHVEGLDPDFPPSAARLHHLGEQAIERLRKEAGDLHTVSIAKFTAPEPTDEERKSIGVQMMGLKSELEAKNGAGRSQVSLKINPGEFARAQDRVRAEYAAVGEVPPSPLALSKTALRSMQLADEDRVAIANRRREGSE